LVFIKYTGALEGVGGGGGLIGSFQEFTELNFALHDWTSVFMVLRNACFIVNIVFPPFQF